MAWRREYGDLKIKIEDESHLAGKDYLAIYIDDGWITEDFQITRHQLQRLADDLQEYLDA